MSQSSAFHTATVFVSLDQVIMTETHLPIVFTEEDILHYVFVEQAQLFPTLDQEIYFDFLIKSVDEENKQIVIVACNKRNFSDLASTVLFLKIAHEDFKTLNLLPWRQREKQLSKKKQRKILTIVAVGMSVFMLVISLFYIHQADQDKKRSTVLLHRKQAVISRLVVLEKSNQNLLELVDRWKNNIETAHHQSDLEKVLVMVESQRPGNMVLEKILWKKEGLLIKGKSERASTIKQYIANLMHNKMDAQLKFMGNSIDKTFPVQFEIEAEGVLK